MPETPQPRMPVSPNVCLMSARRFQGKRIDNTSVRDEPYEFILGAGEVRPPLTWFRGLGFRALSSAINPRVHPGHRRGARPLACTPAAWQAAFMEDLSLVVWLRALDGKGLGSSPQP